MTDTPESRRDDTVAQIIAAGGVILAPCTPLATPDDPHTVAAYRISAGAPTLAVRAALASVRVRTEADDADLIDWTPEPQPEPVYEEPIEEPAPEEA